MNHRDVVSIRHLPRRKKFRLVLCVLVSNMLTLRLVRLRELYLSDCDSISMLYNTKMQCPMQFPIDDSYIRAGPKPHMQKQ